MDREEQLHSLARALERRYPGVRVEAWLRWRDGRNFRTIRFEGPPALIEGYGLAPCGLESRGYFIDETGSALAIGWIGQRVYSIHHHDVDTGAVEGRIPSQHPGNTKTLATVRRILKGLQRTADASR